MKLKWVIFHLNKLQIKLWIQLLNQKNTPELDKLASKVASDPNLMKQLEKALAQGGVMMNEELEQLDNSDMKTLALNLV